MKNTIKKEWQIYLLWVPLTIAAMVPFFFGGIVVQNAVFTVHHDYFPIDNPASESVKELKNKIETNKENSRNEPDRESTALEFLPKLLGLKSCGHQWAFWAATGIIAILSALLGSTYLVCSKSVSTKSFYIWASFQIPFVFSCLAIVLIIIFSLMFPLG